jgi:hydrogenase maturation protease
MTKRGALRRPSQSNYLMTEQTPTRKIVMGLGNTLNRDEGLGVHALQELRARLEEQAPAVEFLDGGVLGLNLLPWVEEASHLLVLDAINARKPAGTLIELARDEIPLYTNIKLSDHQVTFQEVLGLANFRDRLPANLHMVGLQPNDLSVGAELSTLCQAALPQVLARAEEVLRAWSLLN